MGSGVADQEVFDWQLEQQLNEEHRGGPYSQYEILNFGVAGYTGLQELWVFENDALSFHPNAVFYVAHQIEKEILVRNFADRLIRDIEIPYDYLVEIAERADVQAGMSQEDAERLLIPYADELLTWTYRRLVSISQENGVIPVWIFMPTMEIPVTQEVVNVLAEEAKEAGFVVVTLDDMYEGQDISSLIVAEWDLHPNAKGHRLIAENLYREILTNPDLSASFGIRP
jgi:hypothetical protein